MRPSRASLERAYAEVEGPPSWHGSPELRRIRLLSVGPPVAFIVVLLLVCFVLLSSGHLPPAGYALLIAAPVLVVVVYSRVMLRLIDLAQRHVMQQNTALGTANSELERRKREGHAFYDVLLQISHQAPAGQVLSAVVDNARSLLMSDGAGLCLDGETAFLVRLDVPGDGTVSAADHSVCSLSEECVRTNGDCPERTSPAWTASMSVPVRGPFGDLGELWISRREDKPFTRRDREFLVSLSGLVEIALASARAREHEHQESVVAERERIAREMHDSLAQVLGATHLRLRALGARAGIADASLVHVELEELADMCHEAYQDVREGILGLSEASRPARGLLDSLRVFVEKYSRQSGIKTVLVTDLEHGLDLSPRCEVQIARVIQEALTNVRKHSGATSAVVSVCETEHATVFVVEDDGEGFDFAVLSERDGYGLHSMRDRMVLLDGRLSIDSRPGHGTRVVAEIPVVSPARQSVTR